MADVEIDLEITDPQELVGLGIRAYAIGDFSNAAAAFGRATQLLAEKNGDEHDSLGAVYIHYAKSLLEVSREEAEPLGDAIPHGDEESSSEDDTEEGGSSNGTTEKEETAKDEEEAKSKEEDASKKEDEPKKEEDSKKNDESKSETKEDKEVDKEVEKAKEEEAQNGEEPANKTNGESSSKQEEETQEEEEAQEENCTDLQLAWEVLEVAKRIFTNRGDSGKEQLAETLILLGEVAMESENFEGGINDMKAGIDMQKELFEPTSRKLAESYYKLGIAHSTVSNIDEAVECFKNSIEILKKRITFLKETKEEKTGEKTDKKISNKNDEIEEMENLIPEIEEKISDTKSIKEEMAVKLLQEMAGSAGSAENKEKTPTKQEAASSNKPNDISHLVKRKRKADDDSGEGDGKPSKKPTP